VNDVGPTEVLRRRDKPLAMNHHFERCGLLAGKLLALFVELRRGLALEEEEFRGSSWALVLSRFSRLMNQPAQTPLSKVERPPFATETT